MQKFLTLPEGYRKSFEIDLQKDKKLAVLVNVLALVIMAAVVFFGCRISPIEEFFAGGILPMLMLLVGMVLYLVLHELVHGIFMRAFSGIRPHYGFTGLYAYAGSDAYFDRNHYLVIGLAPVVIWGIVLAGLCAAAVGTSWFWLFYLIEAMNLSGAAGDLYVTWRLLRQPSDILVQDSGVAMIVYTRE